MYRVIDQTIRHGALMKFKTAALLTFFAVSFLSPAFAADYPRIVATPAITTPVVQAVGEPTKLDAGKFLWLDVTNIPNVVSGSITWDFSASGLVELLPEDRKPGDVFWGGWKQGDDRPAWTKVPKNSVPIIGDSTKVESGKFSFVELPDISTAIIGGTRQGESGPKFHSAISKTAVPLLGIKDGLTTVSAWGVVDNKPKKLAEITIAVGSVVIHDDKKTEPVVTAKDIYIAIVKSAGNLTPAQANLISDVPFWDSLKTGKSDWSSYNTSDEISQKKGYTDIAMKIQTGGEFKPVMIVLDAKDGTKLYADFLPSTKDEIKSTIAKVRK